MSRNVIEIVNIEGKERETITTTTTNWNKEIKETTTETAIINWEVQVTESVFENKKHIKKGKITNTIGEKIKKRNR